MSEYFFGLGSGWLGARARRIAQKHGAELTNYTDDTCQCGYGCQAGTCKNSRRHWFSARNYGEPFNSRTRNAVMEEL